MLDQRPIVSYIGNPCSSFQIMVQTTDQKARLAVHQA